MSKYDTITSAEELALKFLNEPLEETEQKSNKSKKSKKDKYNGFKVPPKKCIHESTPWALHVYNIISEAKPELLLRDDVKIAYNNFVDLLIRLDSAGVQSWIPDGAYKYKGIIPVDGIINKSLPFSSEELINMDYIDKIVPYLEEAANILDREIIRVYSVLFELIKADVVPYIENKESEKIRNTKKAILRRTIKNIEKDIQKLEKEIEEKRKLLCEYATKFVEE